MAERNVPNKIVMSALLLPTNQGGSEGVMGNSASSGCFPLVNGGRAPCPEVSFAALTAGSLCYATFALG